MYVTPIGVKIPDEMKIVNFPFFATWFCVCVFVCMVCEERRCAFWRHILECQASIQYVGGSPFSYSRFDSAFCEFICVLRLGPSAGVAFFPTTLFPGLVIKLTSFS